MFFVDLVEIGQVVQDLKLGESNRSKHTGHFDLTNLLILGADNDSG
jgi:hypothetical protein